MTHPVFDDRRYTVCGIRLLYSGTMAKPTQGFSDYHHSFRQSLILPRISTGHDVIARAVEEGELIFPTGILRTEREYGGNPMDHVRQGTAWLVFGFKDNVSDVTMETFGRRVDIVLERRQFADALAGAR